MDLSSTQRQPRGRRRLFLAATTAVSTILFVHYGSSIHNYYHASSTAPTERGHHNNIIYQPQEQEHESQQQPQEQQRRLDECYDAESNWHLAMKGKNTCSNDQDFPSAWNKPSMSRFFQPTCQQCCEAMFPRLSPDDCGCQDYCGEEEEEEEEDEPCTTADGPCCDDRYWHPDVTASRPFTCTNTYSDDGSSYPSYWNDNPLMVGTSMFETVEGCCAQLTNGDVAKCIVVEAEECKSGDESGSGGTVVVVNPPPTPKPTPPTPKPTLLITIPPHLLQSNEETTPRPTLLLTIPPHLIQPAGGTTTPRPTLHLTIPPQLLLNPPTEPPQQQQDGGQQPSPVQDACSKRRRRRGCNKVPNCEWVDGSCRAVDTSSSVNDDSSSTETDTDTEPTVVCTDGFKWHRSRPSEGSKCTNDLDYPKAWDDPQYTDKYLFDTPEKCCIASFPLDACTVINACGEQQMLILPSSSSSSSGNSGLVSMSDSIPTSSSSSNCSGQKRIPCKKDSNCFWKRSPHRICVAA
mmetsp:Transcript_10331/g.15634  ORF Transcript_10331/g.15634 Transcript_10331/m.15634 type:complete len:518 (-) Transcript_10331:266-1819(-)